jgi:hypothetical protein
VTVNDDDPEELSSQFQIAQYKVEVKTTTTGEPRLTPLQASTCSSEPETFVLCVVDLRDYPTDIQCCRMDGQHSFATLPAAARSV